MVVQTERKLFQIGILDPQTFATSLTHVNMLLKDAGHKGFSTETLNALREILEPWQPNMEAP